MMHGESNRSLPGDETPNKTASRLLRSMKGRRTNSFGELVASVSMDEADTLNQSPGIEGRLRAHTAPIDLLPAHLAEASGITSEKKKKPVDDLSLKLPPREEASVAKKDDDDTDEDVKRAMAMALAIQNHPNMSPDEIRELLTKERIQIASAAFAGGQLQSYSTPAAATPLIPGRLTNLMNFPGIVNATAMAAEPLSTWTDAAIKATTGSFDSMSSNSKTSFRERARGRFNDLLTGNVGKHQHQPGNMGFGSVEEHASSSSAEFSSEGRKEYQQQVETPKESGGIRLAFRHTTQKTRSPPRSPIPTDAPDFVRDKTAPELQYKLTPHQQAATTAPQQKSAPIRISGIAWKRRGGMGKFSTTAAWERRRIELQGTRLLYYQATDGEEQDESLSPSHRRDASTTDDIFSSMATPGAASNLHLTFPQDDSQDQATDGVVVAKRANWLEQAAITWTTSGVASDDPTAARGYIDLAKEKATVQIAYGHSGAPSPFAISVKVRGETKWKLCFDYHKTLMDWFFALTDVVVQCSVDSYNKQLLQSVDPANQMEHLIFHPPTVAQPPSKDSDAAVYRLWQTGSYSVSNVLETSCNGQDHAVVSDRGSAEDDMAAATTAAVGGTSVDLDESTRSAIHSPAEDMAIHDAVAHLSTKTWTIPEKNIMHVVGVLNLALVYARSSSTTMDGFWYLVVLSNLGIYLCLTKEPDWRSVLTQARTLFGSTTKAADDPIKSRAGKKAPSAETLEKSAVTKPKTAGYIPVAGCSTVKLKEPTNPPVNDKGDHFAGWRAPPGNTLMVRSHGYLTTKAKVSSPGELYNLVNVDIFESPSRYPDMGPRVKLPKVEFPEDDGPKTWRAPNTFIVSIALPTDHPTLGRTSSDGGGYTITMYYQMKKETRDILKRVTGDGYDPSKEKADDPQKSQINAVRLFEDWCRRSPNDPKFQARFKVVPNAHNLKEIGMPGWISKYNGKPFLIKRPGQTGFLFSHPELSCMEFDISLHPFPYLAKQAICFMKDQFFRKVLVTFGFVIEGRADDELPECLIGLTQLCYPDPKYAIQAEDFFAGTCPRSF